jgi:hypothetical protein
MFRAPYAAFDERGSLILHDPSCASMKVRFTPDLIWR